MKKKKIKNLTLAEAKKLCDKNPKLEDGGCLWYQCDKCKYGAVYKLDCKLHFANVEIYGEEEVEIDD